MTASAKVLLRLAILAAFAVAAQTQLTSCLPSQNSSAPYADLNALQWAGGVDGFCEGLFHAHDQLSPTAQLSCERQRRLHLPCFCFGAAESCVCVCLRLCVCVFRQAKVKPLECLLLWFAPFLPFLLRVGTRFPRSCASQISQRFETILLWLCLARELQPRFWQFFPTGAWIYTFFFLFFLSFLLSFSLSLIERNRRGEQADQSNPAPLTLVSWLTYQCRNVSYLDAILLVGGVRLAVADSYLASDPTLRGACRVVDSSVLEREEDKAASWRPSNNTTTPHTLYYDLIEAV